MSTISDPTLFADIRKKVLGKMNDENEKEFDAYYLNNCFANFSQSTNFPTYKK